VPQISNAVLAERLDNYMEHTDKRFDALEKKLDESAQLAAAFSVLWKTLVALVALGGGITVIVAQIHGSVL
jgi:hypothetical protein